jgi:hypothetical protein
VALIEAAGFEVENPDHPLHDAGYKLGGMDYFTDIVSRCAALAFMRFQDGSIGAGVGKEILAAQRAGIPIYDITEGSLVPNDAPCPILTVEETRALIAEIRANAA